MEPTPVTSNQTKLFLLAFQSHLFTPVYTLVLIFGLLGNLGALYYFICKIKEKSPSNVYIINLAMADTLFLCTLPFRIHYHLNESNWVFGDAMCRITGTLYFGNIYISIIFMTCICVDRYIATLHPHTYLQLRNKGLSIKVSAAIWLIFGVAMLAFMVECPGVTKDMCFEDLTSEQWMDLMPYNTLGLIFGSLLPSVIILVCYPIVVRRIARIKNCTARGAQRVIYAILAITILCFLPYHIVHLLYILPHAVFSTEKLRIARRVTTALISLNSLLDPVLYYFATGHYKWRLKRLRFKNKKGVYTISNDFSGG